MPESVGSPALDDPFADRRLLVLLASYRDAELPRTIANALTQAAYPEHLRFAICHQYDAETADDLVRWSGDPRFAIDAVPFEKSLGCCWARARTFDMFDDEPYILQVDAHSRFAARWDQRFIDMLESLENKKSILTCYPPSYTVDEGGESTYQLDGAIHRLALSRLNHDLTTLQTTEVVQDTSIPGHSPLLAAGQIFTRGSFCTDVPYDPEIYFAGEEISLAVRAFTSGYDLYHPNQNLIWHRYKHGEPLHWEDHPDEQADLHAIAVERLHVLLSDRGSELGRFGLGTERSLHDFEQMTGIDFSKSGEGSGWAVRGDLELDTSAIDFSQRYQAWVFAVFAENERELYRNDITDGDVLDGSTRHVRLDSPDLDDRPVSYILWPVLSNGTFATRSVHHLDPQLVIAPTEMANIEPPDLPAALVAAGSHSIKQHPDSTTITIDRSVIQPRDDYVAFVVAFLDSQGVETSRVEVTRPDVLDLSVGTIHLHDVDATNAVAYAVFPLRRDGVTGSIRVQPLDRP